MNKEKFYHELKEHHYESYGWALYCCNHDEGLAKEVLQTAYLKALRAQESYKGRSSMRTWLFSIIKNTSIDMRKKISRHNDRLTRLDNLDFSHYNIANSDNQPKNFFDKALSMLSERQKELMHLVFYQDLSINEAAEVMEISGGTARKHYHRAKEQLKKWIITNKIN
ncbi:MAG: RNA polymerase sigma factor [Flavobacteriaceae bacterium]|nr:RNA polymerase sigma factor [Flavobacteriaceae bacterium]